MKETSQLEMMTGIFGKELKKATSKQDLLDAIEEAREQMWEELNENKTA